jgi:quercetin dioxygenase-like cupin family protein
MRVRRIERADRRRNEGEIFVGRVETQTVLGEESPHLRVTEVTFRDGARNRLHVHSTDQLLIVTEGEGIVATQAEEREVTAGDVAHIPAGEPHWHGARPGRDMTHLAVLGPATTRIVDQPGGERPQDY